MKFPYCEKPLNGVAVPVFSLKSKTGFGSGEFADLLPFGTWARSVGFGLIQILPVNDTGTSSSPYSALSAYALNPLYIRLLDLPEAQDNAGRDLVQKAMDSAGKNVVLGKRVNYEDIRSRKLSVLRELWKRVSPQTRKGFDAWIRDNEWVKNYALFCFLKERQGGLPWWQWTEHREPTARELARLWKNHKKNLEFWVWLQIRLDEQFLDASTQLDAMGLVLKGDIPILIAEDSADLWADRNNFLLTWRAGAPPDALGPGGQNWNFPIYNWDYLKQTDFRWWKNRLQQASRYYHSFRIDHVLGFFRIWAIPNDDFSAMNGHYEPSVPITSVQLKRAGFDEGRIAWISQAHFSGDQLDHRYSHNASLIKSLLQRIEHEDMWKTGSSFPGERTINKLGLDRQTEERLNRDLRNRILMEITPDHFYPCLNFRDTAVWQSLSDTERQTLENLVADCHSESEKLWEKASRELLEMMKADGTMLVCAEDLGDVPSCVPGVLKELGMLSLRVFRWERDWEQEGQPFLPIDTYPELSVTTTSVHDTSTMRAWLHDGAGRDPALHQLIGTDPDSALSDQEVHKLTLAHLQKSSSLIVAHPLQDYLALDSRCTDRSMQDEQVNRPGTVSDSNWSWRMKPFLEELPELEELCKELKNLNRLRTDRSVTFPVKSTRSP